jgi:hypothetical protein
MGETKVCTTLEEVADQSGLMIVEMARNAGQRPLVVVTLLMTPAKTTVGIVLEHELNPLVDVQSLTESLARVLLEHSQELLGMAHSGDGGAPS